MFPKETDIYPVLPSIVETAEKQDSNLFVPIAALFADQLVFCWVLNSYELAIDEVRPIRNLY